MSAIGIVTLNEFNNFQVMATSDGWVVIAPIDGGDRLYPQARAYVGGGEAIEWAARARTVLGERIDTLARPDSALLRLPPLARGPGAIAGSRRIPGGPLYQHNLSFGLCGRPGYGYDVSDAAWLQLADAVERAGRQAVAARPTPRPPTLRRPYYASEVSCRAEPRSTNPQPQYPRILGEADPRPREVGVRVVVDTAGRAEPGSIAVLPGTPARFAAAARATIGRWRFTQARWAGWPVRQVVHVVLSFDPDARAGGEIMFVGIGNRPEPHILFDATSDGWVRVTHGSWATDGTLTGGREWLPPDTVRAWLNEVDARLDEDAAQPKIWRRGSEGSWRGRGYNFMRGGLLVAGYPLAVHMVDSVTPPDSVMRLHAQLAGCSNEVGFGEPIDSAFLSRARRATGGAVRQRATPLPLSARVYDAGETACSASVVRTELGDARFHGTRVEPLGPRTPGLDEANAVAEVMTSFVVDTLGRVEPGTLVVMPGSDFRAVGALRDAIQSYEFSPARRSGQLVRQLVIRTWTFLPPPKCEREDAAMNCRRVYSADVASPVIPRASASTPPAPPAQLARTPEASPLPLSLDTSVTVALASSVDSVALRRGTGALVVQVLVDDSRLRAPAKHGRVQLTDVFRGPGERPCGTIPDTATIRDGSALLACAPGGVHELRAMSIGWQRDQWAVRVRPGFTDTVRVVLRRNDCDLACPPYYVPDETTPACAPAGPVADMFRRGLVRLVTDTGAVADEQRARLRLSRVPAGEVQHVLDAPTCARALAVRKAKNPLARGPVYLFRIGPTRFLLIARNERVGEWRVMHILDDSFASLLPLTM